jgi:DNA-directed RNA polymerase beta subunit
MTIAQLKETILGKVLVELGMFGDGEFRDLSIINIMDHLQNLGFESHGNEILYNGMTGEQIETRHIGPVFYQRLKHMVNDAASTIYWTDGEFHAPTRRRQESMEVQGWRDGARRYAWQ